MSEVYQAKDHLINGFWIYLIIFYEEADIYILLINKIKDFILTTSSTASAVLALGDQDPEHHV